ncbi:transporter [Vibrio profundum]
MGEQMAQQELEYVEFDYTSFLSESCGKQWTFVEAMNAYIAGLATTLGYSNLISAQDAHSSPEDRLWHAALKVLSTNHSDESNLVTLCTLAKTEGIESIKLVMPYPLNHTQIDSIMVESGTDISCLNEGMEEEFIIQLKAESE